MTNRNPMVAHIRTQLLYGLVYINKYYGLEVDLDLTESSFEPLPKISQLIKQLYINAKELYRIYG